MKYRDTLLSKPDVVSSIVENPDKPDQTNEQQIPQTSKTYPRHPMHQHKYQIPAIQTNKWTPDEDAQLLSAIAQIDKDHWETISTMIDEIKTPAVC